MRASLLALLPVAVVSAGCTAPGSDVKTDSAAKTDPAADAAWAALSERVEAQLAEHDVPGMQVSVVLDGRLAYTGAWGTRTYGGAAPVTDATVFRWASVTKMHTATAVLQLAEDGLVDLDAPITDHLDVDLAPGFDPAAITPRQLLTHTAALPDVLDWRCDTDDDALGAYVRTWSPPLYAPPGSFYNYSNSGYTWIGALIEAITGETYADAMAERVLAPAGMATATLDADAAAASEDATGHSAQGDEVWSYELDDYDCAPSRPAAWLHGTATDLARTAEWQLAGGGDLLSAESVEAMHDQLDTHWWPDGTYRVGMGQFAFPYAGLDVVFHDGWVTGFVSAWAIVPASGFGVAVVANADWADPYAVMYDAFELFLGAEDDTWPEATTDPDTWEPYTGTYVDPYEYGTIEVRREGRALYADFVDVGEDLRLWQQAGDYFWAESDWYGGIDVRFIRDDTGTYEWFVTRGGVGTRADEPAAARAGAAPGAARSPAPAARPRPVRPPLVREGRPPR